MCRPPETRVVWFENDWFVRNYQRRSLLSIASSRHPSVAAHKLPDAAHVAFGRYVHAGLGHPLRLVSDRGLRGGRSKVNVGWKVLSKGTF